MIEADIINQAEEYGEDLLSQWLRYAVTMTMQLWRCYWKWWQYIINGHY